MPLPAIGFPHQPRHNLMSRLVGDLRSRSDTAREEAVTGRLADPAKSLNGRVSELVYLERALSEVGQYRQIISLSESRAAAIQGALDSLIGISADLSVSGQTALDSHLANAGAAISTSARNALGAAISALNVSLGGRSLFAGDAGDGPSVANIETFISTSVAILEAGPTAGAAYANLTVAFTTSGGPFDATLYAGGTGDAPSSEIAPGERISFAPRADAPPLRALLRDLAALAAAFDHKNTISESVRRGLAERAIAGLRDNADNIVEMASHVGAAEEQMAVTKSRHDAAEAALTIAHAKLAGRDQFDAAAELTQIEAQLETAYLATVRLANLSLANFLR